MADKGGPVFNIQPGQDGQFYAEQALQQQQLYADPQINLQNLGSQGKQEPAEEIMTYRPTNWRRTGGELSLQRTTMIFGEVFEIN